MPNISPYPRTCLTLDRYARIMGINPVHFQMSYTNDVFPLDGECDDVWYRYAWQFGDRVSLDEIALELATAERDIQNFINYPLCPTWVSDESKQYPRFYRRELTGVSGRGIGGFGKSLNLRWMKVWQAGVRGTEEIVLSTPVTYLDLNGDGFTETAEVKFSYDPDTFIYPDCNIKVYVEGTNADARWEIRYAREITRDSIAGEITMIFDTWMFVDPDKQAAAPTVDDTVRGLDLDDPTNLQQFVDVYAEFNDMTMPSAIFYWEQFPFGSLSLLPFSRPLCTICNTECNGGCGCNCCDPCSLSAQGGCMTVRDRDAGIVVPHPAVYDETEMVWKPQSFLNCREPDQLKMYYKAGAASDEFLAGDTCDPLSDYFAETVAMLATARLKRSFCGCCGASAKAEYWQTDMARQGEDQSFLFEFSLTANPFGTRIGEMQAFRRLSAFNVRKLDAALL